MNFHKILKQIQIWLVVLILTLVPLVFDTNLNLSFDLPKILVFRILVSVLVIVFVVNQFSRKEKSTLFSIYSIPFFNKMGLLFFLFVLSLIVSLIFSVNSITSFWGSYDKRMGLFTYLHLFIFGLALINTFRYQKDQLLSILKFVLPISIFINLGFSFYQLSSGVWDLPESRVVGTFGQANYLAGFVILVLPILAWFFQNTKNKVVKIIQFCAILSSIILIFMTKSRLVTVIFVVLLFLSSIYLLVTKYNKRVKILSAIMTLILGFVSLVVIYPRFNQFGFLDDTRVIIFENVVSLISQRPLFGYGFDNQIYTVPAEIYKNTNVESITVDRSHNEFLDQILNIGLLGFISFSSLLVLIFYRSLKNFKLDQFSLNLVAFIGVSIFLTRSLLNVNGIVHYIYFVLFMAILISENFEFVRYNLKLRWLNGFIALIMIILGVWSINVSLNEYIADKSYKSYLQTSNDVHIRNTVVYNPNQSRYLSEFIGSLLLSRQIQSIDEYQLDRHLNTQFNYPQFYYISSIYYGNIGEEKRSSDLYDKAKNLDPNNPIFQK